MTVQSTPGAPGADGVGRAIAVALATRGDRVAVHYGHDRAAAERTLAALPGEGHVVVGDTWPTRTLRNASSPRPPVRSGPSTCW